jgi:prevent-host-death family protein
MQTVSKSQFKAQVLEYLRAVEKNKKPLIVTHVGKPVIKIFPYKDEPNNILKLLRGSVTRYNDPYAPVGENDWEERI